jgi:hypothetical protein
MRPSQPCLVVLRNLGAPPSWFPNNLHNRARDSLGLPPGGDPFDQRARPGQALVALRHPYVLRSSRAWACGPRFLYPLSAYP